VLPHCLHCLNKAYDDMERDRIDLVVNMETTAGLFNGNTRNELLNRKLLAAQSENGKSFWFERGHRHMT